MKNKFYAIYRETYYVLVFETEFERDEYVEEEQILYPDFEAVSYDEIRSLIEGKEPVYDEGYGCMAILN